MECTEWPQHDDKYVNVKSTLYKLSTYPQGPCFALFHSKTTVFEIQGWQKMGK